MSKTTHTIFKASIHALNRTCTVDMIVIVRSLLWSHRNHTGVIVTTQKKNKVSSIGEIRRCFITGLIGGGRKVQSLITLTLPIDHTQQAHLHTCTHTPGGERTVTPHALAVDKLD